MKYGIKSITMDDVSRELSISKKTLYQYVTDKDDLVGKIIDNEIELRQKEIIECVSTGLNAVEELFEISVIMNRLMREQNPSIEYDLKKYYPQHYLKIVKARWEGIYNYILLNLKKGKKEKLYRPDMDEEIIAKLYVSRSESIHISDLFTIEEFTSNRIFLELLTYHVRGIATERGIMVLEQKIEALKTKTLNHK